MEKGSLAKSLNCCGSKKNSTDSKKQNLIKKEEKIKKDKKKSNVADNKTQEKENNHSSLGQDDSKRKQKSNQNASKTKVGQETNVKAAQSKALVSDHSSESKRNQPLSLFNIGATCYLNSAFQGISACSTFVSEINDLCSKYPACGANNLHVFKDLMDILNGCSRNEMDISRNPIFCNWNKPGQQDSYELLAFVINEVYNQLRKHKEDKGDILHRDLDRWLKEDLPMRLRIQYKIQCKCKIVIDSPLQSDIALHISIPVSKEKCILSNLIDLHFTPDQIHDYECDNKDCDAKGAKKFTKLFRPLPRTICVHLQRTFWNGSSMMKINKRVSFSNRLRIASKYISEEDVHSEELSEQEKNKDEDYNLVSVIVHSGDVEGGHYISYKLSGEKWYLTNDSWVQEVKVEEVLNCQAYVLFYEQPLTELRVTRC